MFLFAIGRALAGDPDFCEVEDGGSNAFMRNSYVEMGIGSEGAFGESSPPSSWHTRSNTGQLGFVANPQDDGWSTYYGDFFTPGSPLEGWGLKIDGTSYINFNDSYNDIAGNLDDPACDVSVCRENSSAVIWTGTVADVDVEQQYAIADGELYIIISTTLTNNGVAPLYDLFWFRNVDPDNSQSITGDYSTTNTIISQPDSSTDLASVEAVGSDGATLYLMASDSRARVIHGGFFNTDAEEIWNGTSYYSVVGESATDDAAISIAIKIDYLDVGESTSFRTIYALDSSAITNATECAEISVIPVDTDGDSIEDDLDVCAGYDDLADSDGDSIPDGCDVEEPPTDTGVSDTGTSSDTGAYVDTGIVVDTDSDTAIVETGYVDTGYSVDTSIPVDTGDSSIVIDTGTIIDTSVVVDTGIYDTGITDTSVYDTDTGIIVDTSSTDTGSDTGTSIDTSVEDTSVIDTGESTDTSVNETGTDTSVVDTSIEDTGIKDTSSEVETGVCYEEEQEGSYYGGLGCSTSNNSGASFFVLAIASLFSMFRKNKKILLTSALLLFAFPVKAQDLPLYNDNSIGSYNNIDTLNGEDGFAKINYSYKYQPVSYIEGTENSVVVNSVNLMQINTGYKTKFIYFIAGLPIQTNDFKNYNLNEVALGPAFFVDSQNIDFVIKPMISSTLLEQHRIYGSIAGSFVWTKNKLKIGYGIEQQIKNNVNEYDLDISSNLTNSLFVSLYDFSIESSIKSYNKFNQNIGLIGVGWNKQIKNIILHPYAAIGYTNTVGTPKINAGVSMVYLFHKKPYIDPHLETIESLNKSVSEKTEQIVLTIDKTKELEALVISLKEEINTMNSKYKEEIDLLNEKLRQKPKFISSLSQQEQTSLIQFSAMVKNKPKIKIIIESKLDCKDPISNLYAEKYSGEYKSFLLFNEVPEINIGQETVCETYAKNMRKAKINIKLGEITQ